MRITLRLHDATLEYYYENTSLRAVFDLSSVNNKVLSTNTQLYIEHISLPDINRNDKSDIGYFTIRSPDIGRHSDWDSDKNQFSTMIYTAPIHSRSVFHNNNGVEMYNFKVSQNFLHNTLTLDLNFYDDLGQPLQIFQNSMNGYTAIKDKIKALAITLVLYDEIDPIQEASKDSIKGQNIMRSLLKQFKRI